MTLSGRSLLFLLLVAGVAVPLAAPPLAVAAPLAATPDVSETGATRPLESGQRLPSDAPQASTRQPLVPAASVARGPRLFERCTREAIQRRYRGAERRHFVRRCQLGYGRRLFRRRLQAAGPG